MKSLLAVIAILAIGCSVAIETSVMTATPRATLPPTPMPRLILEPGAGWSHSSAYATFEGQVTNDSTRALENVAALITYSTAAGTFITSDHALIDLDPLLPGQTSPFSVLTRYNPAMATARVEFQFLFGASIHHTERQ